MPYWIDTNQAGFVARRETRDNMLQTTFMIHKAKKNKKPVLLMLIDTEKTFDKIDWEYMITMMHHLGVGTHIYNWIIFKILNE